MKRLLIMLSMLFCIATAFAQNITKAEYFFDIDQGIGNGTSISNFSPADVINLNANIAINTLAPGFHVLLMRVLNSDGVWSLTESRYFYISSNTTINTANITAAEYFIDTDPGAGNGISTPVGITGAVVNFTAMIPADLSPGFHRILIRTKDADGKWGLSDTRTFYVYPPAGANMPIITAAEYFFDHDPGVGSGTPLSFATPGDIVTQTFMIPVPAGMSAGDHFLTIRAKDQAGNWSLFEKDTLTIGAVSNSLSCPANVTINAADGQCSAVVNNIDPVITPAGSAYTYTLSGATTGNGNGTASGKTFNAGVTTVTYALTNSPATTCSFIVTVNSNITPSVSIIASSLNICSGQQVTFTATPVNGGATPSYQWKVNGNNIPGASSSTYQSSSLLNDDIISVVMTSSFVCADPLSVPSNNIPIAVTPSVAPIVFIGASATTICSGTTVTFNATPVDGGANPTYQWKLNGNNVGTNSTGYQNSSLQNGDKVKVVLTSSAACASPLSNVSEEVTMTVNTAAIPSVRIEANEESICNGQSVTFTARPNNAGNNPVYEWTLNGSPVGSNSPTYQTSTLANGDEVRVTMTPSQSCGSNTPVVSNTITMTVGADITPTVTMSYSASSFCTGSLIIFYASPISGEGNSPSYQWKRNGINIPGATSSTYQSSSLENGDVIRVAMTSSLSCANPQTVLSHDSATLSISSVPLTPSVTISASTSTICQGETVTFTALPTNGGDAPSYQWKVNGNNISENDSAFSSNSLKNGDVITVEIFTSVPCFTSPTAISSPVTMTITTIITYYADLDGDGYGNGASGVAEACIAPAGYVANNGDCDDNNASVHPGSTEICGNGIDEDCDGQTDEACGSPDNDSDGYTIAQGDCNDNNATIHPGATEICENGIDEDCDGQVDEGCVNPDSDGDGYTVAQGDCNDNNAAIHPGAAEICGNNLDDDCDGQVDESCVNPDSDGDGYTIAQGDCNDNSAAIHPGATEICGNGIDDNCNGTIDENCKADLPVLNVKTYPVKEGDVGYTTVDIEVKLDRPAVSAVRLNYATDNDDAIAASDYVAANGVLIIPPGSSSATIQVKVIGDLLKESNERFRVNFTNPVNVVLPDDPYSRIMIIDDDKGKVTKTTANNDQAPVREETFKIPTITKRNQVWVIPQIGNYENEVLIVNVQGQVVNRFVNYHNQTALGNVSTGLYFYRIRIMESPGQYKHYAGRLLITE